MESINIAGWALGALILFAIICLIFTILSVTLDDSSQIYMICAIVFGVCTFISGLVWMIYSLSKESLPSRELVIGDLSNQPRPRSRSRSTEKERELLAEIERELSTIQEEGPDPIRRIIHQQTFENGVREFKTYLEKKQQEFNELDDAIKDAESVSEKLKPQERAKLKELQKQWSKWKKQWNLLQQWNTNLERVQLVLNVLDKFEAKLTEKFDEHFIEYLKMFYLEKMQKFFETEFEPFKRGEALGWLKYPMLMPVLEHENKLDKWNEQLTQQLKARRSSLFD